MTQDRNNLVVIVGGGPAGYGAALALHNKDYKNITVLEARPDMNFDEENSYLVGINVRGKNAINNLFEKSDNKIDIEKIGVRTDQWKILVGPGINVANFDSGLVTTFSRAGITNLLYDEVKKHEDIKVLFGHKAKSVDLKNKTLTCEIENGAEKTFKPDFLIVADGYRSKVRDQLAEQDKTLKVKQWNWRNQFRMLIGSEKIQTDLNPHIHYIYNSCYIAKLHTGKWTTAMSITESSPKFLQSTDPSDENVKNLRELLKKKAPPAEKLFTDEELRKYFSRTVFQGAVTKVSKLLVDNWALILGDAAHSTFPGTGEGINSSLEDCYILQKFLSANNNIKESFINFEKSRLLEVNALSDIAYSVALSDFRTSFQLIAMSTLKKFNLMGPSKEDLMYGKNSTEIKTYSDIYKIWLNQAKWLGGANIPREES